MAETALSGTAQREKGVPLLLRFRNVGVLAVLLLLVIGSAILTPKHTFVGIENLQTLVGLGPELGVVALAVGVLMIAGEFDLSVGSILAVCAFSFAAALRATGSPWVGVLAALIFGGL